MSVNPNTSGWSPNWPGAGRCGCPPSPSPASWTPTPWPGWNRRCAGRRARCAARRATNDAATWRSLSISRRLMRSAVAAADQGPRDPPTAGSLAGGTEAQYVEAVAVGQEAFGVSGCTWTAWR